ncbi:heavy metal translocating P-type ATPase [Cellulophaga omnivescoria]|uniref:heavy metal translocating P-type ATPase n=1 Tax=Cellulophaga omnivescoria TaxID=1888890 RepID=UPI00098581D2|nr:heavy metal translocating P-type ATPase [Cellulophaga omnivescoria]
MREHNEKKKINKLTRNYGYSNFNTNSNLKKYIPAILSSLMLLIGIAADYYNFSPFFKSWFRVLWYSTAYLPVGLPVLKKGIESIKRGSYFTEFLLMSIATLGAFVIGEYPEGVTVMLFYTIGEFFQSAAVTKAKRNIKALLDVRPNKALVLRSNSYVSVLPSSIKIGETVQVRTGEKIPIDGVLLSTNAYLNTAAVTGESKPQRIIKNTIVYAGSINLQNVIEVKATKEFKNSSIARILDLVQNATARKSKTELFIRKFAKIYTPAVVFLAIGLTFLPYFFVPNYVFADWLYRALIFLVISCPCALVISIPLGYFGGLGAASKNGILFKGASFLDTIAKVNTLAMDKTGTITKGIFTIQEIKAFTISESELMKYTLALEATSTHPIAKALLDYPLREPFTATDVKEIAGKGIRGIVNNKKVLVGNAALLLDYKIDVLTEIEDIVESSVLVAINGEFVGYVIIADEIKEDAKETVSEAYKIGVKDFYMFSGDRESITKNVAKQINVLRSKGDLLPEQKLKEVEELMKNPNAIVAFVGDGINDAPVLAVSDIGIAMGGLGSDVAIETADVIIQTDEPIKIVKAIKIGKSTRAIVWQNIALAFGVKLIVLLLGAAGLATMWEAVFADVGVALLAILNAVRLQTKKW